MRWLAGDIRSRCARSADNESATTELKRHSLLVGNRAVVRVSCIAGARERGNNARGGLQQGWIENRDRIAA